MRTRLLVLLGIAALPGVAVPTPREYLGFTPGDDYKLADSQQIFGYFHKLAATSDRIRLVEFGKTSHGKPLYVALISAPDNLQKLDAYKSISRRLALGQATAEEAKVLAAEGRAIVWIDSGLHASEVAPVQHAPELAYQMITSESEEITSIRRNVILMQVPVINPDGLDWIAHWYWKNVGTPYELAALPHLYHRYAGHDNNRDWFMLNLSETRHVSRLLFREWFPQIVYNQHQAPPFPARIFVPPYAEPLNPHIQAPVMEGINLLGMAIKERLARENKTGVLSYHGYDAWWNGGLRSVPAFHNMHGILTETALHSFATPRVYKPADLPASFSNGMPTREPSIFYERPWLGGKWGVRDAVDYMLSVDFAILSNAAARRSDFLLKSHQMARAAIEAGLQGNPYAYVLPPEQWDRPTAIDFLRRLWLSGVEIQRAESSFSAGGKTYPEGTFVLPAAQAFRPYLMDLIEPQRYPELQAGVTGPTKRPYDVAGWTLSMQMGVTVDRVDARFDADLSAISEFPPQGTVQGSGKTTVLDHRENASFLAIADILERGGVVRWSSEGEITIQQAHAEDLARQFGVSVVLRDAPPIPAWEMRRPRVALYQPWIPNADQGWTEWLLEQYRVPYTLLHNEDFRKGEFRARFDTVILASQSTGSILHGVRAGERDPEGGEPVVQRPEHSGGIGIPGLANLHDFVRGGGTLIALAAATELPVQHFGLPVRNVIRSGAGSAFYCPGSLLRVTVDPSDPLAFGIPKDAIAFSTGGEAFEIALAAQSTPGEPEVRSAARFAASNLLASGWVSGEGAVVGKHALLQARFGNGRVVLFAFRPQFRGQPHGTFKFLLNAIYLASAQRL